MQKQKANALKVFEVTLKSVETLGLERTISALETAIDTQNDNNEDLVNFIFKTTCKYYNITKDEIINGNTRNGKRYLATVMISHILCKYTRLSQAAVSRVLNKTQSLISQNLNYLKSWNEKIPVEKQYIQDVLLIEKKLQDYINNPLNK